MTAHRAVEVAWCRAGAADWDVTARPPLDGLPLHDVLDLRLPRMAGSAKSPSPALVAVSVTSVIGVTPGSGPAWPRDAG